MMKKDKCGPYPDMFDEKIEERGRRGSRRNNFLLDLCRAQKEGG